MLNVVDPQEQTLLQTPISSKNRVCARASKLQIYFSVVRPISNTSNESKNKRIPSTLYTMTLLQIICEQLFKNDSRMSNVFWSFENESSDASVTLLVESLMKNTNVQDLFLADVKMIENEGLLALARLIECNSTLENIHIGGFIGKESLIDTRGFARFGCALACCRLRRLVLSGFNNLSDHEVTSICTGLALNTKIHYVNLSWNDIGNNGAQAIANMLMANKSIRTLYLQENNISDSGIEHICTALKENCTLQSINFSMNSFSSKGVVAICNMLKSNRSLKVIRLSGTIASYKKDNDEKELIRITVEQNFSLEEIHVDDEKLQEQLDFYTALNTKFHRYEIFANGDHFSVGLWAYILAWYGKASWQSRHQRRLDAISRSKRKDLNTKKTDLFELYGMTMWPSYEIWLDEKDEQVATLLSMASCRNSGIGADVLFYFIKSKPELFQTYCT